VLAEDSYLVREGVSRLLAAQEEIEVVGVCGDLEGLLQAVEEHLPDVVVTDIRMPPDETDEGIRAARRLRETHPETGVVVLSQFADPSYALRLFEEGSHRRAYVLKERVSRIEDLVAAIQAVAAGDSVVDPKVVERLVEARSRARQSPLSDLTPREREVLAHMAEGKANAAIAAALVLTERAVEKHINSIFAKLGIKWETDLNRRVKAVLLFLADQGSGL
jgi:DNA-binding NarL/FixJ family response regulator